MNSVIPCDKGPKCSWPACYPECPGRPGLSPKKEKVKHVKRAVQSRTHHCHWPGCEKQVPPAKWGCYPHWMKLPKVLRDKIWSTYRVGQEETLTPSRQYVLVAREVQEWIRANHFQGPEEAKGHHKEEGRSEGQGATRASRSRAKAKSHTVKRARM